MVSFACDSGLDSPGRARGVAFEPATRAFGLGLNNYLTTTYLQVPTASGDLRLGASAFALGYCTALYHRNLGARPIKPDIVHESPDQHHASAIDIREVLRICGIGQGRGVEPRSLISDRERGFPFGHSGRDVNAAIAVRIQANSFFAKPPVISILAKR